MATFSYKIKSVDVIYVQADNANSLSVGVELFKEGDVTEKGEPKVFEKRRLGFPLDTKKEEILEALEKLCVTLASDEETSAKSELLDKQLTAAEKLKEDLLS